MVIRSLECSLQHKQSRCRGVALAVDATGTRYELIVLLEIPPEVNGTSASTASSERVRLSKLSVESIVNGTVLHLSAPSDASSSQFSMHLRPNHLAIKEPETLAQFAAMLEEARARERQGAPVADDVPTSESVIKAHLDTYRARPRQPRRALNSISKYGHRPTSNLGGHGGEGGSGIGGSPAAGGVPPNKFYNAQSATFWGSSKGVSAGNRQLVAATTFTHASSQLLPASAPLGTTGAFAAAAAPSSPMLEEAPLSASRPKQLMGRLSSGLSSGPTGGALSARDRALLGNPQHARSAGGPTFGDPDAVGTDAKQPRLEQSTHASSLALQRQLYGQSAYPLVQPRRADTLALKPQQPALDSSRPAGGFGGGGGGFRNIGNTCYMNAVLSSLLGLPSFVSDVLSLLPLFQPSLGQHSGTQRPCPAPLPQCHVATAARRVRPASSFRLSRCSRRSPAPTAARAHPSRQPPAPACSCAGYALGSRIRLSLLGTSRHHAPASKRRGGRLHAATAQGCNLAPLCPVRHERSTGAR